MLLSVARRQASSLSCRSLSRRSLHTVHYAHVPFSSRLAIRPRPISSDSTHNGRQSRPPKTEEAGVLATESTDQISTSSSALAVNSSEAEAEKPPEPRLSLTMTCTVPDCHERSTHQFSKRAYERGIVLVTCPKCKNRYVIIYASVVNVVLIGVRADTLLLIILGGLKKRKRLEAVSSRL